MGQYFTPVNIDRQEYYNPPSAMNPIERVTDPVGSGMLSYLLFEGPMDGTSFTQLVDEESELYQNKLEEFLETERKREEERFEKYTDEESYAVRKYKRKFDEEPDLDSNEFRGFCREQALSSYRDDGGEWDYKELKSSVAAGLSIDDLEFAGRWAGDEIRFIGDYAENEIYDEAQEYWVYEYKTQPNRSNPKRDEPDVDLVDGDQFVAKATDPIVRESIQRLDIIHSSERREVEEGDLCQPYYDSEQVYAEFVEPAEQEWTNITDGLTDEFVEFVGEEWVEDAGEISRINPDMVLNA